MRKVIQLSVCALFLAGCEVNQGMAVDKGKDMIASTLKDPDSARFESVYMVEEKVAGDTHYGFLCGSVNSKNSFGGFTGAKRFAARLSYSTGGTISVSDVQLEEGQLAKAGADGRTMFETFYWQKRCIKPASQ